MFSVSFFQCPQPKNCRCEKGERGRPGSLVSMLSLTCITPSRLGAFLHHLKAFVNSHIENHCLVMFWYSILNHITLRLSALHWLPVHWIWRFFILIFKRINDQAFFLFNRTYKQACFQKKTHQWLLDRTHLVTRVCCCVVAPELWNYYPLILRMSTLCVRIMVS